MIAGWGHFEISYLFGVKKKTHDLQYLLISFPKKIEVMEGRIRSAGLRLKSYTTQKGYVLLLQVEELKEKIHAGRSGW